MFIQPTGRKERFTQLFSPSLGLALLIGAIGCLAIFNATAHSAQPFYFVGRQCLWLFVGLLVLLGCQSIPIERLHAWTLPVALVAMLALYAVLFWGKSVNGMRGWFVFSTGVLGQVYLQPSELAKPVYILFLSRYLLRPSPEKVWLSWRGYLTNLGLVLPWLVPVVLQPDFGTLVLYVGIFALMYWLLGGRFTHLCVTMLALVPAVIWIASRHTYVRNRLTGFLDPTAHAETFGWHIVQFQTTLANGGWWGQPIGKAMWSNNFLPLGYSDSIFASIGESIGFVGVMPIVFGTMVWLTWAVYHGIRQPNLEHAVLVVGLAAAIGIQAFVHLGVTVGLLPPTGITLPMFSYGGSSLVSTMVSLGLITCLLRTRDENPC